MIRKWVYFLFEKVVLFFYWTHRYVCEGDFTKKHFHLRREGNRFSLRMIDHDQYLTETEEEINRYQERHLPKKTIAHALKLAIRGCNFIVFMDQKSDRFVQFDVHGRRLIADFPIAMSKKYRRNYYKLLGILTTLRFIEAGMVPKAIYGSAIPGGHYEYSDKSGENAGIIRADFRQNIDLATEMTLIVFKEVFRQEVSHLDIKIG